MARPGVLWIGHKKWRVRYRRRLRPERIEGELTKYHVGACDPERRCITVDLGAPDLVAVLLHEVVHAGWFEAGYNVHGERRIDTAVWAILEALRGNPRLVDLLLSSLPCHRGKA